jgi:sialate O-acetylesterase
MCRCFLSIAALIASSTACMADSPRLAALFSDHMVLQRDKPVPVWGWAEPGTDLTVSFAGQTVSAKADQAGRWKASLAPLPASADPRELTIRAGTKVVTSVKDVLVGEVWLGSGQSNMAMTVNRCADFPKEQQSANFPLIRMFREESPASEKPCDNAKGTWAVCSPQTVGGFSGTLYFFGRELHRELKVPVGLINSSVGGTPIESWVAAEAQLAMPELKPVAEAKAKADATFDPAKAKLNHEKALAKWKADSDKAKAAGQPAPRKPIDPVEARARRGGPGGLFNGKINPLIPYALRGVTWYQGEANTGAAEADFYQHYLKALIADWRSRWADELPFAWVQLPNFNRDGEGWPLVREGMKRTLALPRTGMAITIDIGDPKDIHPANKQDVGKRLALWALATVYGRKVESFCGPIPTGHGINGSAVSVSFHHADGGLVAKGGDLVEFELAGTDGVWKPAKAVIVGQTVQVSSPEVAMPVGVRYGWSSNPACRLFNGAGLPASPFRIVNREPN